MDVLAVNWTGISSIYLSKYRSVLYVSPGEYYHLKLTLLCLFPHASYFFEVSSDYKQIRYEEKKLFPCSSVQMQNVHSI